MSNFICKKRPQKNLKKSSNKSKLLNDFEIIGDIETIICQSYIEILQKQAIRHANELQEKDVKIQQLELEYEKKQELLAEKSTPSYTEILNAQAIRHANELQEKDLIIQKLEMEYQAKLMLLNKK